MPFRPFQAFRQYERIPHSNGLVAQRLSQCHDPFFVRGCRSENAGVVDEFTHCDHRAFVNKAECFDDDEAFGQTNASTRREVAQRNFRAHRQAHGTARVVDVGEDDIAFAHGAEHDRVGVRRFGNPFGLGLKAIELCTRSLQRCTQLFVALGS